MRVKFTKHGEVRLTLNTYEAQNLLEIVDTSDCDDWAEMTSQDIYNALIGMDLGENDQ